MNVDPNTARMGLTGKNQGSAQEGFDIHTDAWRMRANRFATVLNNVNTSTRGATADISKRVDELMRQLGIAAGAGDAAAKTLPMLAHSKRTEGTLATSNPQAREALAANTMTAKRSMFANAMDGVEATAARIISDALLAASPGQPSYSDDFDVSERRADVRAILGASGNANTSASSMLREALATGDDLTVYVLTCAASGALLKAMGVNLDALRKAAALGKAGPLADYNAYALANRYVPCLSLIVAQESDDSSLAAAIDAARTCGENGLNEVEAAMASGAY
jgi:hypothetical protein